MSEEIFVRKCESMEEFHRCVELQRRVWGEADLEVEPATMFVVAAQTGGQTLGAFAGGRLVGFTLAVAGLRGRVPYLHSHMTGVDNEYRDRGVGRMLKLFQREEALGRGIRLIQWTFDPLELRNAHFNLNRLGVICREYHANLYGVTTSPLHRGLATDRLVAESGDHRVACGAGELAARGIVAGWRCAGTGAGRVHRVVCKRVRGGWLTYCTGKAGVSAYSLERFLRGRMTGLKTRH
jgi:hypothetical protein